MAGDNLFDYALSDFVALLAREGRRARSRCTTSATWRSRRSTRSSRSTQNDRVLVLRGEARRAGEQPRGDGDVRLPRRARRARFGEYLTAGEPPDPIGLFPAWLHSRAPVYGYRFEGEWLDIGDHGQLLEADNRCATRAGMPRASTPE